MSEIHPEEIAEPAADVICHGGFRLPSLAVGNAPPVRTQDQGQQILDHIKETYGDE